MHGVVIAFGGIDLTSIKNSHFKGMFSHLVQGKHAGVIISQSIFEKQIETLAEIFGNIPLLLEHANSKDLYSSILSADIIIINDGISPDILNDWKQKDIDKLIIKAWKKGTLLVGVGTGSAFLFKQGLMDDLTFIEGFNIINALGVSHYNTNTINISLYSKIARFNETAICMTDNCALEIQDKIFKIVRICDNAKIYKIYAYDNALISQEIKEDDVYSPMEELLSSPGIPLSL